MYYKAMVLNCHHGKWMFLLLQSRDPIGYCMMGYFFACTISEDHCVQHTLQAIESLSKVYTLSLLYSAVKPKLFHIWFLKEISASVDSSAHVRWPCFLFYHDHELHFETRLRVTTVSGWTRNSDWILPHTGDFFLLPVDEHKKHRHTLKQGVNAK